MPDETKKKRYKVKNGIWIHELSGELAVIYLDLGIQCYESSTGYYILATTTTMKLLKDLNWHWCCKE